MSGDCGCKFCFKSNTLRKCRYGPLVYCCLENAATTSYCLLQTISQLHIVMTRPTDHSTQDNVSTHCGRPSALSLVGVVKKGYVMVLCWNSCLSDKLQRAKVSLLCCCLRAEGPRVLSSLSYHNVSTLHEFQQRLFDLNYVQKHFLLGIFS